MLSSKLHSSIGNTDKLYVDDVFSAYTYTGNSSAQTINNGIDLAGKGGLVWFKSRSQATYHYLFNTLSGAGKYLSTNNTFSESTNGAGDGFASFNSNGFSTNGLNNELNGGGQRIMSWTFAKAPKFFDVVTYTGNGTSSRAIAHSLGQEVGMVMTKATSTAGDWNTYHRSATGDLVLNGNNAQTGSKALVNSATTSTFTVSGAANTNAVTYVAYLFAHDPYADGIVQCGSYSGTNPSINLGWEPQFIIAKCVSLSTAYTGWGIFDSARGLTVGKDTPLLANSSDAENGTYNSNESDYLVPTATGFTVPESTTLAGGGGGRTYIYLAIRRPNKPPTTGTEVYKTATYTSTSGLVVDAGFPPDLSILSPRNISNNSARLIDRLRGVKNALKASGTDTEDTTTVYLREFLQNGVKDGLYYNGIPVVNHFFKRAPGFFDVVCSQSTPGANLSFSHGLGVVPELIIHKDRGFGSDWDVWTTAFGGKHYLKLNSTSAATSVSHPSTLTATTVFSGSGSQTSNSPQVCYLFASLPGISKVGSYTGNGSSQTINCGFSTGARFVLIKRTDSTGDWFVWDTARGIVSANDPHLSLNTSDAEVTTNDSVDPDSTGFIVNQVTATNINVTSSTYLYLAIA